MARGTLQVVSGLNDAHLGNSFKFSISLQDDS